MKNAVVYILTNALHTVLYVGVTTDLEQRLAQHRTSRKGFTHDYAVKHLVYYEQTQNVHSAIEREKQLKRWSRSKKERLIRIKNPWFRDVSEEIFGL